MFSELVGALVRRRNAFTNPKTPAAAKKKAAEPEDEDEDFDGPAKEAPPDLQFEQDWEDDSD